MHASLQTHACTYSPVHVYVHVWAKSKENIKCRIRKISLKKQETKKITKCIKIANKCTHLYNPTYVYLYVYTNMWTQYKKMRLILLIVCGIVERLFELWRSGECVVYVWPNLQSLEQAVDIDLLLSRGLLHKSTIEFTETHIRSQASCIFFLHDVKTSRTKCTEVSRSQIKKIITWIQKENNWKEKRYQRLLKKNLRKIKSKNFKENRCAGSVGVISSKLESASQSQILTETVSFTSH